jgi:cardiolipin synthase
MFSTIPNSLTSSRIILIPFIVGSFFIESHLGNWIGFALFAIASVTDFFDGYLARKLNQNSKLGKFMDPIADKLLVATTLLMLCAFDRIDGYSILAAAVILCREFAVSGLREFLAELKVSVPVTFLAKWKTTVQMFALGFLLVGEASPEIIPSITIGIYGLWIAAILTIYTGYDYFKAGMKHMED